MHSFTFFFVPKKLCSFKYLKICEVFGCFFSFFVSLFHTFLTMIILSFTCEIPSHNLLPVITTVPDLKVHGKQLNRTKLIFHSYATAIIPVNFSTG